MKRTASPTDVEKSSSLMSAVTVDDAVLLQINPAVRAHAGNGGGGDVEVVETELQYPHTPPARRVPAPRSRTCRAI